jgi:hypothetical protein
MTKVYEIASQREPHVSVDPLDIGALIRDRNLTPTIPEGCPPLLQEIMQMCWKPQPEDRPVSSISLLSFVPVFTFTVMHKE